MRPIVLRSGTLAGPDDDAGLPPSLLLSREEMIEARQELVERDYVARPQETTRILWMLRTALENGEWDQYRTQVTNYELDRYLPIL